MLNLVFPWIYFNSQVQELSTRHRYEPDISTKPAITAPKKEGRSERHISREPFALFSKGLTTMVADDVCRSGSTKDDVH